MLDEGLVAHLAGVAAGLLDPVAPDMGLEPVEERERARAEVAVVLVGRRPDLVVEAEVPHAVVEGLVVVSEDAFLERQAG